METHEEICSNIENKESVIKYYCLGTFINDVPCFLAIFYLPTYLVQDGGTSTLS